MSETIDKKSPLLWVAILGVVVAAAALILWPRSNQDAIKIGVLYDGTGNAQYAGLPEKEVLDLLVKSDNEARVNNRQMVLVPVDTGGDKSVAIGKLEEWSKDEAVVAVIGPTTSGESIAVAAKVLELEKRLPILSLASAERIVKDPRDLTRPNEWVYKFAQNEALAAQKLSRVIKDRVKSGPIAFLYSDDPFGRSGADIFPNAAEEAMLTLQLPLRSFPTNLNNPDLVVEGIGNDIEAVVIWGWAKAPAQLVEKLRRSHPKVAIFLSHGNASQDFITSVKGYGNGVVVVGSRVLMPRMALNDKEPRDKIIKDFQAFWEAHTRKPQSHYAGHAYDAYHMLRSVLNDGKTSRVAIRKALEDKGPFDGITGTFKFTAMDHAGLGMEAFDVYQIQDGQFVPLTDPAPKSGGG